MLVIALILFILNSILAVKFLAITQNPNRHNFISYVHINKHNYTIRQTVDISDLGIITSATFNGKLISMIIIGISKYQICNINKTGQIYNLLNLDMVLDNVQADDEKLFAIKINDNNCGLAQLDYSLNETVRQYYFSDGIKLTASVIDKDNDIYYACVGTDDVTLIHSISIKNFVLLSTYGPLSHEQHYAQYLLIYGDYLYAFIYNRRRRCIQLVIVNSITHNIETTLTYHKFDSVRVANIDNNVIYVVMSYKSHYTFVMVDLYAYHHKYIAISDDQIPINMWLV